MRLYKKHLLAIRFFLLLVGGAFCSADTAAQSVSDSAWWDMEYIRHSSAWLSSGQAAGLRFLPVNKISTVQLTAEKSNGRFVNFYQSGNSLLLGAATESFFRLSPAVVLQGKLEYDHFNGKNMGGSAFIDPYKNPIDIDENADSTRGTKKLDRYRLLGAVSAQLSRKFSLSGKVDYEAANYAKIKDLRHTNQLLNLDASAGITYSISPRVELGAAYDYIRRTESVSFGIYGNTDRPYISLISFGSFYGIAELHSDNGYTSEQRPLVNNTHKVSLQANLRINPALQLFNEFSYGIRSGYFGVKGTTDIVYTEHDANEYAYTGIATLQKSRSLQHLRATVSYGETNNNENVYRRESNPGGGSMIVYYGQNNVLTQNTTRASIGYTAFLNTDNYQAKWIIKAGGNYYRREQTVIRYPFYRKQLISSYGIHADATRNMVKDKNRYSILLGTGYGAGGGTAKEDGVYQSPTGNQPASRDIYLYEEYEYFTSPRMSGRLELGYSRITTKNFTPYLKVNLAYTKAFDVSYLADHRLQTGLAIGCTF